MQQGANLPGLGSYNRSVVLGAVQISGGISRVEIAAMTGLTAQTVSVIVRRLLEEGLVREDGSEPSSGGKPRTILRVAPEAGYAVGIHFDPGGLHYVLADLAGRPVRTSRSPVRGDHSPERLTARMGTAVRRLLAEAGVPAERVLGIGLACPGPIDQPSGTMVHPPRLPGWGKVPIGDLLRAATRLPVTVDNDATAAVIGERWAGLGRTAASLAYLYLGTGVGGGLLLDGRIYRGRSLNAGEFGHITAVPGGPPCRCGNLGCVEAVCCPDAIVAAVHERLAGGAGGTLAAAFRRDPSRVGHARICAAAAAGDPVAAQVIGEVAAHLAGAVVTIVNVLDLDLIVLGGPALGPAAEIYRSTIAEAVASRAFTRRLRPAEVALSPIAADAAAIGAASLVFHAAYAPDPATLLSQGTRRP
ncbi:ROK family transcriptional regulator [Streptosporangium sp. KLBMP 9127]|nr:ROK family transcriptional regulator [Streptosporangium sp. KLBMP 9127]